VPQGGFRAAAAESPIESNPAIGLRLPKVDGSPSFPAYAATYPCGNRRTSALGIDGTVVAWMPSGY
jgi:hypothetical protein